MSSERRKLRGLVLAEDKRTERFFRKLLKQLGFGRFNFDTAQKGKGSGEAWVARRYPGEVKVMRTKNFQQSLRLITVRDEDGVGIDTRKQQLDQALQGAGLAVRKANEKIATPVPARNIETWLLALLGIADLNETEDYKRLFENEHSSEESSVGQRAASAWNDFDDTALPSLRDGKAEIQRIDPYP